MRSTVFVFLGASLLVPMFAGDVGHQDAKVSPREVLLQLRQGNKAYAAGGQHIPHLTLARRASLVATQKPHAVILTCADSRVPPEFIFNEGLGDLFVVRVAGAVADPVTVGSIEYGVEHLHAPLVVVMGHTRCGAVKAALDTPAPTAAPAQAFPPSPIESILALIRPGIPKGAGHGDAWTAAVYGGVEETVEDLFHVSKVVPEAAKSGEIGVVGAVYEIETGKVLFSELLSGEKLASESAAMVDWKRHAAVAAARH